MTKKNQTESDVLHLSYKGRVFAAFPVEGDNFLTVADKNNGNCCSSKKDKPNIKPSVLMIGQNNTIGPAHSECAGETEAEVIAELERRSRWVSDQTYVIMEVRTVHFQKGRMPEFSSVSGNKGKLNITTSGPID